MEALALAALVLVSALLCFGALARRALVLCELRADGGGLDVARGNLPPATLEDLRDVAEAARLDGLRIRVLRGSDRARVEVRGSIDPGALQRLRNVVGNVPLSQLVAGGRARGNGAGKAHGNLRRV